MKHLLLSALLLVSAPALAQGRPQVVQFTGLVVSGDSLTGVPATWVGVPRTHRYTLTDSDGYFSLPVLAGDSIEVRAPAATTHLRIPLDCPRASYSLLVQLQPDAQPARMQRLSDGFSHRFLELKLPPSLTVQTPPISTKALVPPKYDRMGRKLN